MGRCYNVGVSDIPIQIGQILCPSQESLYPFIGIKIISLRRKFIMKMRKLLAVVLAVTLAISAMAISAFADEVYEIPLYNYTTTDDYTVTYTITVPAYALYGYASQSDYLVLNLPTNLSSYVSTTVTTETEVLDHYEKVTIYGTSTIISTDAYDALTSAEQAEYTAIESTTYTFDTVINYYELNLTTDEVDALDDETKEVLKAEDGTISQVITVDRYNVLLALDAADGTTYASYYDEQTITVLAGTEITIEGYIKTVEATVVSEVSIEDYAKMTEEEQEGFEEAYVTKTTTEEDVRVPSDPDQVIDYYITVNGVTVQLQSTNTMYGASWGTNYTVDGSEYGTFSQVVEIGTFARDYTWAANSTEYNAMVPQSTLVSETTPITITAVIDYSDNPNYDPGTAESWEILSTYWPIWSSAYGYNVSIEYYDANDVLVGEVLGTGMSVTKTYGVDSTDDAVVLVYNVKTDDTEITGSTLYWDHTLANRAILLNAASTEGATAQVVMDLESTISGFAVYTLKTVAESNAYGSSSSANSDLWYSSGTGALYNSTADTYVLAGSTDTLTFDVDTSLLYNSTYGLYNGTMYLTQWVTLGTSTGDWSTYYTYTDYSSEYSLRATAVTLVVTIPSDEADDLVVDEPIEPTDTDEEDDTLDVAETDETPAETNPTTGIVLALVPMAVAAAAAVASKRR